MYDNSLALMHAMREAGIDYRSDTPEDDENLIDTVRVGWTGKHLPRCVLAFRINDRGAHLEASLGDIAPAARSAALELVNALNGEYRWMKFAVEEGGDLHGARGCRALWHRGHGPDVRHARRGVPAPRRGAVTRAVPCCVILGKSCAVLLASACVQYHRGA